MGMSGKGLVRAMGEGRICAVGVRMSAVTPIPARAGLVAGARARAAGLLCACRVARSAAWLRVGRVLDALDVL